MSDDLIYDWNLQGTPQLNLHGPVLCVDETLSAGLQAATVVAPDEAGRQTLVRLSAAAGFGVVNLGLGPSELVGFVRQSGLPIRTAISIGCSQAQTEGVEADEVRIHAAVSDAMLAAAGQTAARVIAELTRVVEKLVAAGIEPVWVAEDATRTSGPVLSAAVRSVQSAGARRVCLSDSVGAALPTGVQRLLAFVSREATDMAWDWAGRNDRGVAVVNALTALSCGASRVAGTALGIGEGPGVVALDTLLTNVMLMAQTTLSLVSLKDYCHKVAELFHIRIPVNYPVLGEDAFRTATGVHAAAIVKARKKGDVHLADRVYSGIPAAMFGLSQKIDIGPMSGISNVNCWLEDRQLPCNEDDISRILARAKQSNRTLTEAEVHQVLQQS